MKIRSVRRGLLGKVWIEQICNMAKTAMNVDRTSQWGRENEMETSNSPISRGWGQAVLRRRSRPRRQSWACRSPPSASAPTSPNCEFKFSPFLLMLLISCPLIYLILCLRRHGGEIDLARVKRRGRDAPQLALGAPRCEHLNREFTS